MGLPETKYKESDLIAVEVARLATPSEKPKTYVELGELVWKAFELGKKYQQKLLEEDQS